MSKITPEPNSTPKSELSSDNEVHNESVRENFNEIAFEDINNAYLGLRGSKLHFAISVMAGIGFLLFGYDQGVMGSLLTLPTFKDTFEDINTDVHKDRATFQGFVVAVYEIGCLVGALFTTWAGDKLGRRKTIFFGCIVMIIGATIQAASYSSGQLIAARIITGIGNGMNTSTVPVWQSECAKPKKRGRLVMAQGALITCGVMISYWVDFGFYFIKGSSVSWRFPLAFQILFPLVILPFILRLPESPRWLMKVGNTQEALRVFAALEDKSVNDELVLLEMRDVQQSLEKENQSESLFQQIFKQGENRNFHRIMLGVWSQIMQQICGINLITYYAGTVFEKYIGMTPLNSRILAACNGTEYFLASWIAFYTIERVGRRPLMLFGAAGQTATMAILTATTWAADPKNNDDSKAAIAAAVMLFLFNTFFAIGWLGIPWLYPAEITPLNVRAAANGLSTAGNWSFNFMVVMITPVAFENIGPYTYTIFAAINVFLLPVVYFLYPETAGRSLEEMDRIFNQSNPWKPWEVVQIAKELPYEFDHDEKAAVEHVESVE